MKYSSLDQAKEVRIMACCLTRASDAKPFSPSNTCKYEETGKMLDAG
jgi:hypothetical protein